MNTLNALLLKYANLADVVKSAKKEMQLIEEALQKEVMASAAPISAHGYTARMKLGRKSIDHQSAALGVGVSDKLIEKFTSTPAPNISWAKITKAAGIDKDVLTKHTTQAAPSFVMEYKER